MFSPAASPTSKRYAEETGATQRTGRDTDRQSKDALDMPLLANSRDGIDSHSRADSQRYRHQQNTMRNSHDGLGLQEDRAEEHNIMPPPHTLLDSHSSALGAGTKSYNSAALREMVRQEIEEENQVLQDRIIDQFQSYLEHADQRSMKK